jgi:hypothetical protein
MWDIITTGNVAGTPPRLVEHNDPSLTRRSPFDIRAFFARDEVRPEVLLVVPTTSLLASPPTVLFMEPVEGGVNFLADARHALRVTSEVLAGRELRTIAKEFREDGLFCTGRSTPAPPLTTYEEVQHLMRAQMAPRVPTRALVLSLEREDWTRAAALASELLGDTDPGELLFHITDRLVGSCASPDAHEMDLVEITFRLAELEHEAVVSNARDDGYTDLSEWVRVAIRDFLRSPSQR